MPQHDGDALHGHLSPCGHRNPASALFCDVCGDKLPIQCPGCFATNRREANFCSNCGLRQRDAQGTRATPSVTRVGQRPVSRFAIGSHSAPSPAPSVPLEQAANEVIDARESVESVPWTSPSVEHPATDDPDDREHLKQIARFVKQRRRRGRVWLGAVSASIVFGLIGAALVGTHIATRDSERPRTIRAQAADAVAIRTEGSASAPFVQKAPTSSAPSRSPIEPFQTDGSATAAAPGESRTYGAARPRAGGTLTFVVPGEPPSYDAHREETFALIHPAAPHYNTLLRIDPFDSSGTRVVGDVAESWTVSSDKRTYVLRLRRGVKFHDGSEMTSRDVRATYEKIINPPLGIASARRGEYLQIETVQAPEPYVVAFKLKWPSPSFIHSLASPWNWIYKADILERDIRWYEKNVMGTGPFVFIEHVKGSRWVGRRNPEYWDRGTPYLDGYNALFIRDDATQVSAIRSGRAHMQFRGFSPAQRDDIVGELGEKITVQESPWNCGLLIAINHDKAPFQDRRVRRALSLALDRYSAADSLSKTAIVGEVAGVQLPRSPFATSPVDLTRLAGYWRDIREARVEARRLLMEAGVPKGTAFVLKNRDIPMPYQHIGAWLVNDWAQIGLKVHQEIQDSSRYFADLRSGNFELSTDFQCGYVVDPDLDLYKFQSRGRSDANYSRYTDPVLDDLYVRQSRSVDPEQRRRYIRAFERRLLDEEAHYIYTLQWHRIVPHSSRVRGWTITPSHYLNNQLDMLWLTE